MVSFDNIDKETLIHGDTDVYYMLTELALQLIRYLLVSLVSIVNVHTSKSQKKLLVGVACGAVFWGGFSFKAPMRNIRSRMQFLKLTSKTKIKQWLKAVV